MTISTSLPISENEFQAIKARYQAAGQDHLFTFFEELGPTEQQSLYQQLLEFDVERINQIYHKAIEGAAKQEECNVEPLSEQVFDSVLTASPQSLKTWETLGLTMIAQGKVAVILMAGGQGTRLGSSDPKGCYDINLPSKKSLFQLQAERILRLQTLARQYKKPTDPAESIIPWYIMTSGPTHQPTVDYFKKHNFFGLKEENIYFFEQGTLPCLTMDGKIILESKSKVAIAPDGNGGIYAAVQNKGVIADLKKRGILYSHCYCVDNCLAKVADPVFIGYCVSKQTDCGVKVVGKAAPEEPVGVVCRRNGNYGVVEYSEISKEVSERRKADGSLAFGAANIANHFFSTEFLERVPTFASQLEYHIAKKKIKYVDLQTGEVVAPTSNSGMKLECFVFDVFPYAKSLSVLEVDRKEEFSPLKNAPGSGADCPETSRRDIIAQHARFIINAGGHINGDLNDPLVQFELSPWVSYGGEGLQDIVQNKTITLPAIIETKQDLIRLAL
ncbi:nucleotide-diphospho-sugar transferase [Halteromyces radiatus]|uniref:nucleotide-diphospho-sugar transferase n=1 Tax=Halteromyces radiatus TaxID=101107 RepID=UPI00221E95EF|nr:nucleotide-diphospho-sugar transferase [Halteromyces radiatus]KAI8081546.1 nucleotide-diphospho-sugar transferase [Halteromyces radiatus]